MLNFIYRRLCNSKSIKIKNICEFLNMLQIYAMLSAWNLRSSSSARQGRYQAAYRCFISAFKNKLQRRHLWFFWWEKFFNYPLFYCFIGVIIVYYIHSLLLLVPAFYNDGLVFFYHFVFMLFTSSFYVCQTNWCTCGLYTL